MGYLSFMANAQDLDLLRQGVRTWNRWRAAVMPTDWTPGSPEPPTCPLPDLTAAPLTGAKLAGIDLRQSNLSKATLERVCFRRADLRSAGLYSADLSFADLRSAKLQWANAPRANFSGADLRGACLDNLHAEGANFFGADLSGASLHGTDINQASLWRTNLSGATIVEARLSGASLIETQLVDAKLDWCRVYGISVWGVNLERAAQSNLLITRGTEPNIWVDDLEVAQFIYLLLNNKRLRNVIDTVTSKTVLILGCFTTERKAVLDALHGLLRNCDYVPILFDFAQPHNRDLTETVQILAHMARFVIADLTDSRSIPQELARIVPYLPSVPVQPILLASAEPWGMYETWTRYPWVHPIIKYRDLNELLANFKTRVIRRMARAAKKRPKSTKRPQS
jgi:hypothetical protein